MKPMACAVFISLMVGPTSAYGTSIVFVRYPGGYVVGADSKRNYVQGGPKSSESVCKLHVKDGVVVATYGTAGWHQGTDFMGRPTPDLYQLSQQVLDDAATRGAEAKSKEVANFIKENQSFRNIFRDVSPEPLAGWVFIDGRGGFEAQLSIDQQRLKTSLQKKDHDALGFNRLAAPYMEENFGRVRSQKDAIQLVSDTLLKAVEDSADAVGKPFSIIVIDQTGSHWVEFGACRASAPK